MGAGPFRTGPQTLYKKKASQPRAHTARRGWG